LAAHHIWDVSKTVLFTLVVYKAVGIVAEPVWGFANYKLCTRTVKCSQPNCFLSQNSIENTQPKELTNES
jgi:hypothetical protein